MHSQVAMYTGTQTVLEHPAFRYACAMLLAAGEVNGLAAAAAAAEARRSSRVRHTDRLVDCLHPTISASLSSSFTL